MLEGDDSGYPYPVASKVVEGVLTELRIPQAIEENRQAIEALEPAAVLTFDEIWNMGFVTGDWVDEQGYLTESQIQAMIDAIGAGLGFDGIWDLGFRDEVWLGENFINKDDLIANYVRKTQLGLTVMTLPKGDSTETQTLNGFMTKVWRDGKVYPNDSVIGSLMSETADLFNLKLDKAEFNTFLKTGVTPEFMDLVAGSLMDVDVKGLKTDLNVALANRPTFGEIPSVLLTLGSGRKDDIEGFLNSHDNWILGIFNLSDPFKNQVLVQTLGVEGSRIKQFDTCFRGTGSGLEALTTSIKDEAGDVSARFDELKVLFNSMKTDFENFAAMITQFQYGVEGTSATTNLKSLLKLLKDSIGGLVYGGGDFSGVANLTGVMSFNFDKAEEALTRLKAKADELKTCGKANLSW